MSWVVVSLPKPVAAGMTVHELYKLCRERFLVSNELALRSHLNEFRDHQLVQMRCSWLTLSFKFCMARKEVM